MADINVTVEETVVAVTVSGGPGPQGDQGIQGPQGDPGVFDPEDPVVTDTLTVLDDLTTPTKGYRLRASGSALDFEATGADLLISNWSGPDFTGTQRSYDRLSADAMNVQHAGKREFVTSLYGPVVHTIDPDAGTASFGGKNGLTAVRLCGLKSTPGSPSSGTWATGDVVLDSVGGVFICTNGGTPGTWVGSNDLTTVMNMNTSNYQYYIVPAHGVTTTITLAADSAYFTPLVLQQDATLTDVQIDVSTLDAAGTARCGLASSDADGLPGTWLADLGDFASVASTGVKSLSSVPSQYLSAGVRYWIALVGQGNTTLQVRGRSGWNPHLVPTLIGTTPGGGSGVYNNSRTHYRASGVTGALSGAITIADVISSGPTLGIKLA